ncbi:MAG TPA: glycosyltransferase [Cyclobacteriaceae bacterium]|nr:glycosyltransferase [Cyclobacteriaceae bacterium]
MNILFYTPVNFRCREIESLTEKFIEEGHKVFFLSQCPRGEFHKSMERLGADIFVMDKPNIANRVLSVIQFCRKNKIDVCFSHLEPTNFVSVLAQYFLKTRFIIYRHHINEAKLAGFDGSLAYKLTYRLAKTIICVSRQAKEYMISEENVHASRIFHINLGYNFNLYPLPPATRKSHVGIQLLSAGRLNKNKRPRLSVELLKKCVDAGLNCSLVVLGVGEEESNLRELARKYNIQDRVTFAGYTHQILDYMAEADILVHPSVTESSCVVVKEAALVGLPVIVCQGVGDFDDYMKNGLNGAVLPQDRFVDEAFLVLQEFSKNPQPFKETAKRLRTEITTRFNIDTVIGQYNKLIGG